MKAYNTDYERRHKPENMPLTDGHSVRLISPTGRVLDINAQEKDFIRLLVRDGYTYGDKHRQAKGDKP